MQTDGGRQRGNLRGIWQDVASYRPFIPGKYSRQMLWENDLQSLTRGKFCCEIVRRLPGTLFSSVCLGGRDSFREEISSDGKADIIQEVWSISPEPWPASFNPAGYRRKLKVILESWPASRASAQ